MFKENSRRFRHGSDEARHYREDRPHDFDKNDWGRHRHGENIIEEKLAGDVPTMLLFVGSLNCLRHKPYQNIGSLMQQGRAAILCPSMSDFSSGRYVKQIKEAVYELSEERGVKRFMIACGCQWVILSTDGELLAAEVKEEYGLDIEIFEDAHLEFGDHA